MAAIYGEATCYTDTKDANICQLNMSDLLAAENYLVPTDQSIGLADAEKCSGEGSKGTRQTHLQIF